MVGEPQYHKYHNAIPCKTYVCDSCGSLVVDKHLHDEWHDYMVMLIVQGAVNG